MEKNFESDKFLSLQDKVKISGSYDVIVVGGGVAGVAAAMASARKGAKTLLIEKSVMLGGLATIGYIVIYLPLCDGEGRKLIGGISEELLWLSIKNSYHTLPDVWQKGNTLVDSKKRYQTLFNGPSFTLYLDDVVLSSGANILFDTLFCGTVSENGRITHVIVENRDGRLAYESNTIVDATGDASVFASMGAKTVTGDNYLSYWGYYTDLKGVKEATETEDISKAVKMLTLGADCNGVGQPECVPVLHGNNAAEINEFLLKGRKEAIKLLEEQENPHTLAFTGLPSMPQFRTTRMICGAYALKYSDSKCRFEDSIGCCGDWRKAGVPFEIPYRTLVVPGVKNVISAGRIISCGDTEAWEVTRVIPVAAMTGEAAGIAAAMNTNDIDMVNIDALQNNIVQTGGIIHL